MLLAPSMRAAVAFGMTSSSTSVEYSEVYETDPGVGSPPFRAVRKALPGDIWVQAGHSVSGVKAPSATVVPWLGPARDTRSSTSACTEGHHRTAHRASRAPWL